VSWQRVRGHDSQIEAFERARRRGRLAHAYLFTGPPGVGKRLFANELARALLCENPPAELLEACDRCPSCAQVKAGTHPDLFVVTQPEDKQVIPIEVMRELSRSLSLKSARGRGKIGIVDDADSLDDPPSNHAGANAFLKTLEEPPPQSLLILIGTRADLQLPTVVSRCQVVRFAPLPHAVVADLLRAQGIEDPARVERLARLSGGSLGQAQALADPALWEFRRKLLQGLVQTNPDTVTLAREWMHFVEEAGKESALHRRRAALGVRLLIDALNDALRLRLGAAPLTATPEESRLLEQLARRADPDQLIAILERCLEGDRHIDRRVQLVLALEGLLDALGQKLRPANVG
jgi:DNA polymerase-3 subunit delta'